MNKGNYAIFLDDERTPDQVYWVDYANIPVFASNSWRIVRTFAQFKEAIATYGMPSAVSYDHDIQDFNDGNEYTGTTCARWLLDYCLEQQLTTPPAVIHSQNGEGASTIKSLYRSFRKAHPHLASTTTAYTL